MNKTIVQPRIAAAVGRKTILKPRLAAAVNTYTSDFPDVKFRLSSAYTIAEKAIRFRHPDYSPNRAQKLISSSMSRHLSTRKISFGFNMVSLSRPVSRRNTFFGGTCAPPSALIVFTFIHVLHFRSLFCITRPCYSWRVSVTVFRRWRDRIICSFYASMVHSSRKIVRFT